MSLSSLSRLGQPRELKSTGLHPISDGFGVFYQGVSQVGDKFQHTLDFLNYIPFVGKALDDITGGALSVFKLGFDISKPFFGTASNVFGRIEETSPVQSLYKQFYGSYGIDPTRGRFVSNLGPGPSSSTLSAAGSLAGSLDITPPVSTFTPSYTSQISIAPGVRSGAGTSIG